MYMYMHVTLVTTCLLVTLYRDYTRPDLGSGVEGEVHGVGPSRVPDIATALAGKGCTI